MKTFAIVWVLYWAHASYFETEQECRAVEAEVRKQGYAVIGCHKEVAMPSTRKYPTQKY